MEHYRITIETWHTMTHDALAICPKDKHARKSLFKGVPKFADDEQIGGVALWARVRENRARRCRQMGLFRRILFSVLGR